jgi:hypothetical protein
MGMSDTLGLIAWPSDEFVTSSIPGRCIGVNDSREVAALMWPSYSLWRTLFTIATIETRDVIDTFSIVPEGLGKNVIWAELYDKAVSFSKSGQQVAIYGDGANILIRDVPTGIMYSIIGTRCTQSARFSHDGTALYMTSNHRGLRVCRLPTLDVVAVNELTKAASYCERDVRQITSNQFEISLRTPSESIRVLDALGRLMEFTESHNDDKLTRLITLLQPTSSALFIQVAGPDCSSVSVAFPDGTIGTPVR